MEDWISDIKSKAEKIRIDWEIRRAEIQRNYESFREVFGNEFDIQSDKFREYIRQLREERELEMGPESLTRKAVEEAENAVHELRTQVDNLYDALKSRLNKLR